MKNKIKKFFGYGFFIILFLALCSIVGATTYQINNWNMTGNFLPTPYVVTASHNETTYQCYKAFDGKYDDTNIWQTASSFSSPEWIQIDLGSGNETNMTMYMIDSYNSANYYPTNWTLQGSMNTTLWNTLDTRNGIFFSAGNMSNFSFSNPNKYRYYVWNFTGRAGASVLIIDELTMYKEVSPAPAVNITWINQSPTNITTFNIIGNPLQINYVINGSTKINTSPYIQYNLSNASIYVNGTQWNYLNNRNYNTTTDNLTYLFRLFDNDVYPATYNVNETVMEQTVHNQWVTTSNNQEMKVQLLNVSSSKNYNIFEAFLNINTTGSVRVYYCNSTYVSGNPSTTGNCVQFGTINSTGFNHTHTYSHHNVLSMTMVNGSLGGVAVTSVSYFVFDRAVSTMQVGYINGSVRTNVTMTTTNSGISWTDQNWTADMHVHQYDGTEILNYRACYNETSSITECSSYISQSIGQSIIPPTTPQVTLNAQDYFYNTTMTIYFTNSTPMNISTTITGYNVTIMDTIGNYYLTINNSATNYQNFTVNNLRYGIDYVVRVTAKDSNGNYAYGESNVFNVHSKINNPCNISITMNSSGVPVLFDYITNNGSLFSIITGRKNILGEEFLANTTTTYTLKNLSGNYTLNVNTSYSVGQTYEITSCWLYSCVNMWTQNFAGCVANAKLITYSDTNNCNAKYDVPIDNGTYTACVTPPNTDKDLWIILILFFVFLVLLGFSVIYPFTGIGSLFIGVILMFLLSAYFTTTPFIYFVALPIVALIIAGFGAIWSSKR